MADQIKKPALSAIVTRENLSKASSTVVVEVVSDGIARCMAHPAVGWSSALYAAIAAAGVVNPLTIGAIFLLAASLGLQRLVNNREKAEALQAALRAEVSNQETILNILRRLEDGSLAVGLDGLALEDIREVVHAVGDQKTEKISTRVRNELDSLWTDKIEKLLQAGQDQGDLTRDHIDRRADQSDEQIGEVHDKLASIPGAVVEAWKKSNLAPTLVVPCLLGGWKEPEERPKGPFAALYGPACDDREIVDLLHNGDKIKFEEGMREALQLPDPPVAFEDGVWAVIDRIAMWEAIGPHIYDEHLDRFALLAEVVLAEPDPKFELHKDQRWAANIYGKSLPYSSLLRDGMVTTLALLGARPESLIRCRRGKAEDIARSTIRLMLAKADWQRWGALDSLFPKLAEASPETFLGVVEQSLENSPEVFDQLFSEEGNGITGGNYMTGLWWALEKLAWHPDYLVRVAVLLARFDERDPGGNWSNRPGNSLKTIVTPWNPQTSASSDKQLVALKVVLQEVPATGWKLLLSLLPTGHDMVHPTQRPSFRSWPLPDEDARPTHNELFERYKNYSKVAVEMALNEPSRLADLLPRLRDLDIPDSEKFVQHILSTAANSFDPTIGRVLWETVNAVIRNQDKYPDANWHWNDSLIGHLRRMALHLEPESPVARHRYLFANDSFDLFLANSDFVEQERLLRDRRCAAAEEVFAWGGIDAVEDLAREAESGYHVGGSYALSHFSDHTSQQIASWVGNEDEFIRSFAAGFIGVGIGEGGDDWLESLAIHDWPFAHRVRLLNWMRFDPTTWQRAEAWLGERSSEYWKSCSVNRYQHDGDFTTAIDELQKIGRPAQTLCLLHSMVDQDWFQPDLIIHLLSEAAQSDELPPPNLQYEAKELIQRLQASEETNQAQLARIEWLYLPVLDRNHGGVPKTLEQGLADDPKLFCELIRFMFRSDKTTDTLKSGHSSYDPELATRSHELLHAWARVPGMLKDDSFDPAACSSWYERTFASLVESGHEEVGMQKAGEVLRHAPADPNGLWLHREVAALLNRKDMKELRSGYDLGIFNSRGCHFVASDGSGEDALAQEWTVKAEAVENAGFHRLAATLREIAARHVREAESIRKRSDVQRD